MAGTTTEYEIKLRKLHPAQEKIKAEAKRFNVVDLGRRTGKTVLGLDLVIDPVLLEGFPAAWAAPTYKLAKEVFVEARSFLKPLTRACNASDMRIELVTNGVLEFWSLTDPDVGRGRKYKRLIVDEAAMARNLKTAWQQALQPTLMDYRGDAFFLSTPKGMNGAGAFFYQLYELGREGSPTHRKGWKSWKMPTTVNPYIHPDEIEQMRLDMPELVFRQEVLAEFLSMDGTAIKSEWLHRAPRPSLDELRIYMAVDLAISEKEGADFTACAVIGIDRQGRVWILHVQRARVGFFDAMRMIQQVADNWKPLKIGIEKVQYQAAAVETLLRTTTLPIVAVTPDRDKMMRFMPMQVRYQNNLVYHAEGLIPEWEAELLSFPQSDNDDMVDAVAYAFLMAGEHGRQSISVVDTTQKEKAAMDVEKDLPGLPPQVVEHIIEIRAATAASAGPAPDTCGACVNFTAATGSCELRRFFVQPADPACMGFEPLPQDPEKVTVDDVVGMPIDQ